MLEEKEKSVLEKNCIDSFSQQDKLKHFLDEIKLPKTSGLKLITKNISKRKSYSHLKYLQSIKKNRQCSFTPIYWNLKCHENQIFICGGFCIDFTFKIQEDSGCNRIAKEINHLEYFKEKGLMVINYAQAKPTVKDISPLIKRALSMQDQQYYLLSIAMINFQNIIPQFLLHIQQKSNFLKENNLIDSFNKSYMKFEKWALAEVMKLDSSRIFKFSIIRLNLNSLEFENTMVGHSKGLLAVRGADIQEPLQYLQKEVYHFFDGESNLDFLVKQLTLSAKGHEIPPCKTFFITFDNQRIEVDMKMVQFTNRDEVYPYFEELKTEFDFKFDFMINVTFFEFSAASLFSLIQLRLMRNPIENESFQCFTYTVQSQLFLEKYYADQLKEKTSNNQKNNPIHSLE